MPIPIIDHQTSVLFNAGVIASFDRTGGVYRKCSDDERAMRNANGFYLESYHYVHKEAYVRKIKAEGAKIFLDSGAFSAYTQGAKIDIGKYCDYCHKHQDFILFPSVLDVIDFKDKNASVKGTYWNQMEMERRFKLAGTKFDATGYGPLPVAHYGEPDEVVQFYADNYPYMALGGLVPISTPQMILWLDHIFERILCNPDGTPRVRVHGFGITSLPVMQRYPWFSVDSSTWVQWASNGLVLHPTRGVQVNISAKSSSRKVKGQHIDNLVGMQRDVLEKEFTCLGVEPDRMREHYYTRWAWNTFAFPYYLSLKGFAPKFLRETPGLF